MAGKLFRMVSPLRALLVAAVLSVAAAEAAHAVTVSPTALYIDSRSRSGVLTLYNPGSLPAEVTIDFSFGYPQSDAQGNVSVQLTRDPAQGEPSALEWMRAFPRRLVLQPGQRQVVRVVVEPPPGLPEGEYWARVLISSRGGQPPIEETRGDLQLQLNVQTTLVIAANYRNGNVATGVTLPEAVAAREGGNVAVELELHRTGNAAFLGRVRAELLDAAGDVIATAFDDIAVYRTMRRRLVLPVPDGSEGDLVVRLTVNTDREDLPPGGALSAVPIEQRLPVLQ
jgi:P pilus assembly chaperone PapD